MELGGSFGSIFLLFPIGVAGAHTHSSPGKSPAPSALSDSLEILEEELKIISKFLLTWKIMNSFQESY